MIESITENDSNINVKNAFLRYRHLQRPAKEDENG